MAEYCETVEGSLSEDKNQVNAATAKMLACVGDDELAKRYPDRVHFIDGADPQHGVMASRALFAGDPVVIVHPDGRETLLTSEAARGVGAVLLLLALFWINHRAKRGAGELVQFPPRTRIEARDALGLPIAA